MSAVTFVQYSDPYLQWTPLQHRQDCPTPGAGWEVRSYTRTEAVSGRAVAVGLRAVCRACQSGYELVAPTGVVDEYGPFLDDTHHLTGRARCAWGNGATATPIRVRAAGTVLWMHPHRGMWAEDPNGDGLGSYYLTHSPTAPTRPDDVVGVVTTVRTTRGAYRYSAALTRPAEGSGNRVEPCQRSAKRFTTPTAAAKWVATQLATTGEVAA